MRSNDSSRAVSPLVFLPLLLLPVMLTGQIARQNVAPVRNWTTPLYWLPSQAERTSPARLSPQFQVSANTVSTDALTFVAITPCRLVDTRGTAGGFIGITPFAGPSIPPSGTVTIPVQTIATSSSAPAPCGVIPTIAQAYSLNVTVVPVGGGSVAYLTFWPAGSPQPVVATLNDLQGAIVANAAIVPAGTPDGGVSIYNSGPAAADVVIDMNGYFTAPSDISNNTAIGSGALEHNIGSGNTASGVDALHANATGRDNTASGSFALANATGNNNIGIGYNAGLNVAAGNNNIEIGNPGVSTDSGVVRIGTAGTQTSFFVAGVRGVTTGGSGAVPVVIDANGQLGTVSSSQRFKEDIRDMGDSSNGLLRLRPVTFRYRQPYADGSQPMDYGLIAEEVAKVYPDLAVKAADGQVETVQYQKLTPMLLNELQKQHRELDKQAETIRLQQARIAQQQAENQKVEARLAALEALVSAQTPSSAAADQ